MASAASRTCPLRRSSILWALSRLKPTLNRRRVEVQRAEGFKGDIKVDLVGFNTGSNKGDEQPPSTNMDITPATLRGTQTRGAIIIKPKGNCPIASRDIALVAESKVNSDTITIFSERIPLTVNEKKAPENKDKK